MGSSNNGSDDDEDGSPAGGARRLVSEAFKFEPADIETSTACP
jgi:hypothetical protein